jgi:hypothetical protein
MPPSLSIRRLWGKSTPKIIPALSQVNIGRFRKPAFHFFIIRQSLKNGRWQMSQNYSNFYLIRHHISYKAG